MLKIITVFLFVATILPFATPSVVKHFPKSCFEYKEYQSNFENGFYTLYDNNEIPYNTYCDSESDAPFVWSLVESMSLEEGQKTANRKGFGYDHPVAECHMTWAQFRLSKARMDTILQSAGTSHYRATCNFNSENGTGIENRVDYLRGEICSNPFVFSMYRPGPTVCPRVEYINVRGQICRKCRVAFYSSISYHNHIDLSSTASVCTENTFADRVTNEDVFGHYNNANPLFSCASNENSTTQWWIGGIWIGAKF